MQHEITINGFDFTIEIIDKGIWRPEEGLFEDVRWKVVDGIDLEEDDFEDLKEHALYLKAWNIAETCSTDEMEEALQEACKKCTN